MDLLSCAFEGKELPEGLKGPLEAALLLAEDVEGPCLVRFILDGKQPQMMDKEAQRPWKESKSLVESFGIPNRMAGDEVLCLASLRNFPARFHVDVASTGQRLTAPVLVVLGGKGEDGKKRKAEVLRGRILPGDAVAAMQKVVRGIEPARLSAQAKLFQKLVFEKDALNSRLSSKKKQLEQRASPQLEREVADLQERLRGLDAAIAAKKTEILG